VSLVTLSEVEGLSNVILSLSKDDGLLKGAAPASIAAATANS